MYRTRKLTKQYNPRKKRKQHKAGQATCPFCTLPDEQIVYRGKHVLVTKNIYPYQFWDLMKVTDHLMVIPKQHIESISELKQNARQELIDTLADYQDRGYNMYGRESGNIIKSVPHQHTHLIKCDSRMAKFFVFLRRPYMFIRK